MTDVVRDPDGLEAKFIRQLARPSGEKVLEVGCGDGRVTWQYGQEASEICGVDPEGDVGASAGESTAVHLACCDGI